MRATPGKDVSADRARQYVRPRSASCPFVATASSPRHAGRATRRIAASASATGVPGAGTHRRTRFTVAAPRAAIRARARHVDQRRRQLRRLRIPGAHPVADGDHGDAVESMQARHRRRGHEGSTTSRTFEIRTGSPGRTTSTVASASAGSPAPTASCGSDTVRRRSLHPVWVPSTTSSTANVAISRSASVDTKWRVYSKGSRRSSARGVGWGSRWCCGNPIGGFGRWSTKLRPVPVGGSAGRPCSPNTARWMR